MDRIVEVSKDALGYVLLFARDFQKRREGDPVTLPSEDVRYFKSQNAARLAAKKINDGSAPLTTAGHIAF